MNSYNFFEPYIKQPEKFNYKRVIWAIVIVVVIFLMVMMFWVNQIKLSALDNQITNLDVQINSSDLQKKVNEVAEIESTMKQIESSAKKLQFLDISTAASQSFTYDIFSQLNVKVPKNVFLSSVTYSNRALTLTGYSESVENVALFTHQLSSLPAFDMVRVSNLISDNDNYSFDMSAITPYVVLESALDTTEEEVQSAESEDE